SSKCTYVLSVNAALWCPRKRCTWTASLLFAAGRNAVQVQRFLGHHSAAFTLSTYVHLLDGDVGGPMETAPLETVPRVATPVATEPTATDDTETSETAETAPELLAVSG